MNHITYKASPGVAIVLIDYKRVGSVRRFSNGRWCAKFDHEADYPLKTWRTRAEAAESLRAALQAVTV